MCFTAVPASQDDKAEYCSYIAVFVYVSVCRRQSAEKLNC